MAFFRCVLVGLLSLIVLGAGPPGFCAEPPPPEEAAALDFAWVLFEQGDSRRVVTEVKRFLFFYPRHPRVAEAERLLVRAKAAGNISAAPRSQNPGQSADTTLQEKHGESLGVSLVLFYQKHLRTFKNPSASCPSYPSCSDYCVQAIQKHGLVLGTFIQADRFFREFTTAGRPPFIQHRGQRLHYDPLELNDYWLYFGEEQ